ncbi:hypothetical protein Gohar_015126, partial [Gossypium harknessii]|nr:hypothetical protein [Gossypium harknessii]
MVGTSLNADYGLKKHKLYGGYKEKAFKKQKSNFQGKGKALQIIKKKKKNKAQIKCFNCGKKDSRATNHVTRDRNVFVDFHWLMGIVSTISTIKCKK